MPETVSNELNNPGEVRYLIFSILDREYAFPSDYINEITLFDAVYPLPLMPEYVLGVINRYSIPYALLDISLLLFKIPNPRSKVLVFKDSIDRIAFLIDDVAGIVDIPQEQLLKVEQSAGSENFEEIISASFVWNSKNVFVLDIQRIMTRVASEVR